MRIRTWILPALLAAPLVFPVNGALACIRFKKPGGAVPPGLREPSDPPPPPPATTPPPTTTPPDTTPPPTTGGKDPTPPVTPGAPPPDGAKTGGDTPDSRKKQGSDDSTWETWWALNRIEFFPHRYVQAVTSSEGPKLKGIQPLAPAVVREKLWKPLLALKDSKQVFIREAALICLGRVASDESLKQEARVVLVEAIKDPNHLVARAAALGLFYVADDSSLLPMVKVAKDPKTESDVKAFLALTLTAMGSDMAFPFLSEMASPDKNADFELVAASLMAMGFVPGPASARTLREAYENKKYRPELRAEAVESFGRRGSFADGWEILAGALDDREIQIRRSAAMAIGILDYRTDADREIAALIAPYDTSTGAPLPVDVVTKVDALKKLIPAQRETIQKPVREIVKKLVHMLEFDNDAFASSMAAISLGRIAGQCEETFAIRRLEADLKKERNIVREYEILALAIAKAPSVLEIATDAVEGKNKQPTTQAAGLIALGIYGDPKGNPVCIKALENNPNPAIRGYAALAMGLLGDERSQTPILSMLKTTKSPDSMSFGALGLALLGQRQGSDMLIRRLTETTDGDVAAYNVYSLGLMKDRSKLDRLLDIAQNNGNFFVQSAATAAIGYVASAEDYPRRHVMGRGFNYMMNLNLLENFFYKL